MSEQFTTMFRDEHRLVRDALLELSEAFSARDAETARSLLGHIAELTGPHFRYEEETMYPLLVQIFGAEYIDSLVDDHDVAIAGSQRLVELVEGSYDPAEIEEAQRVIRKILPHVSDCDGLSIMVEKLRDDEVDAIFAKRDETLAAGLDLLTWDATVRTRPNLAA